MRQPAARCCSFTKLVSADAGIDALVAAAEEGRLDHSSTRRKAPVDAPEQPGRCLPKSLIPGHRRQDGQGVDGDLSVKVETEFQTGRSIAVSICSSPSLPWVQTEALGRGSPTDRARADRQGAIHDVAKVSTRAASPRPTPRGAHLRLGTSSTPGPDRLPDLLDPALAGGEDRRDQLPRSSTSTVAGGGVRRHYGDSLASRARIYPSSCRAMGEALHLR